MLKSGLSALYKMLSSALTAQFALRPQGMPFRVSAPPEQPRYWHQGAVDQKQYARMQAAEGKRERKSVKRIRCAMSSSYNNPCLNGRLSNLNPFYVAK